MQTLTKEINVKVTEQDIYSLMIARQNKQYANNFTNCFISSVIERENVFGINLFKPCSGDDYFAPRGDEGWKLLVFTNRLEIIKHDFNRKISYLYSNPFEFSAEIQEELLKFDQERYCEIKPFWMNIAWYEDTELAATNYPFVNRGSGYICKEVELSGK